MSDATAENGHGEKRRILASLAAACAVHGAILLALALGIGIGSGLVVTPPVTIELQYSPGPDVSGAEGDSGALEGPAAPAAAAPAGAPAAAAPAVAAPAGGQGADPGGFVIPAPRARAAEATAAAGGPAFREAGGKTGVVQGIPSVPGTVPAPAVAPVQQGSSAGPSSGGASSVQRSGTGVLVPGSSGSAPGGKLDLSQLDKSLAGSPGSAAGRTSGGGAGAGTGTGSGGASAGDGTAGGAAGTAGGSGSGGQSYSVVWGTADSGKGRTPVYDPAPKIPVSVSAQGLTLKVTVNFTLLADGVIGGVSIRQSSGSAEVDSAVLDAIRRWRFTPSKGAAPAKGIIPYVIKTR